MELARRGVERERDLVRVPGAVGRLEDHLAGVVRGRQVRREAALVTHGGREAALAEEPLQVVVRLGADPDRLGEALGAGGDEHELLEVERVLGVGAAVHDVEERHGQHARVGAADPAVERHACLGGGRLRDGERRSEDRVRAEPRLRRRAVERDERAVDAALVGGVEPEERVGDLAVDVADRAGDPLPQPGVAAVAELDGLVLAGRGAGWHRREPERSRIEPDLDLDGRIPARVEDLAAVDVDDRCHALFAKRDSAEAESRGLIPACGGADP